MKNRIPRRPMAVALVALSSILVLRAIAADTDATAKKGDEWETTSQMSMEGMPMQMPVTKLKICAAKDRAEPPGSENPQGNCKNLNMKRSGEKVTWDVQCTDPDMTGAGEIIYTGKDSYTGTVKFTSADGNMTVKLTGRKLGECSNPR